MKGRLILFHAIAACCLYLTLEDGVSPTHGLFPSVDGPPADRDPKRDLYFIAMGRTETGIDVLSRLQKVSKIKQSFRTNEELRAAEMLKRAEEMETEEARNVFLDFASGSGIDQANDEQSVTRAGPEAKNGHDVGRCAVRSGGWKENRSVRLHTKSHRKFGGKRK